MDPAISNKMTAILAVPNVFIVRLQKFGPGAEKKSYHFLSATYSDEDDRRGDCWDNPRFAREDQVCTGRASCSGLEVVTCKSRKFTQGGRYGNKTYSGWLSSRNHL